MDELPVAVEPDLLHLVVPGAGLDPLRPGLRHSHVPSHQLARSRLPGLRRSHVPNLLPGLRLNRVPSHRPARSLQPRVNRALSQPTQLLEPKYHDRLTPRPETPTFMLRTFTTVEPMDMGDPTVTVQPSLSAL